MEKVNKRLSGWKSKILSFAGRVELIRSTLSMIHIFWASVYLLPQSIISAIDRLVRDFFWNHWDDRPYLHAIAWDSICLPCHLGGLGIFSIHGLN